MDELTRRSYEGALRDLEIRSADTHRQVADLQALLKELNQTAQTLKRLLSEGNSAQQMTLIQNPDSYRYVSMSVRWAILCLLTETDQKLSVQEIADALIAGGVRTEASNFGELYT
jgi:hypothetical protein